MPGLPVQPSQRGLRPSGRSPACESFWLAYSQESFGDRDALGVSLIALSHREQSRTEHEAGVHLVIRAWNKCIDFHELHLLLRGLQHAHYARGGRRRGPAILQHVLAHSFTISVPRLLK
ncbi:hypothetical protein PsYK624_080580 [Phanerochaete sordida]|uniref:Uncharacterized protein n=1 Tax=Phanerochaete sordida TaxID=48140 RepID=A0A9P3GBV1_9APHY|nr:hypothetical protein PsYK624_080580 [Phanerochaete sordida]